MDQPYASATEARFLLKNANDALLPMSPARMYSWLTAFDQPGKRLMRDLGRVEAALLDRDILNLVHDDAGFFITTAPATLGSAGYNAITRLHFPGYKAIQTPAEEDYSRVNVDFDKIEASCFVGHLAWVSIRSDQSWTICQNRFVVLLFL
jgi:hypothetical protein